MAQLSKRYIPPWTYEKILNIFLSSFLKIRDKSTAQSFLDELLSPTEKIMLAKRMTCLYLLYKNVSIHQCSDILKLSSSTVGKYSIFLSKSPKIKEILDKMLKEEHFLKLVDTIINEYLFPPGRLGSDWRSAGKQKIAYEQRKTSPL